MSLRRRDFFSHTISIAGLFSLGGCTSSTINNTTTITVNVTEIKTFGLAGLNAISDIMAISAVSTAIGAPTAALIKGVDLALGAALTMFSDAVGPTVTIRYKNPKWFTMINNILNNLADCHIVLTKALAEVHTKYPKLSLTKPVEILNALSVIIQTFAMSVDPSLTDGAVQADMTVTKALSILGIVQKG